MTTFEKELSITLLERYSSESQDMGRHLDNIGFPDTPENNEALIKHLLNVGNKVTPEQRT